VLLRSDGSAIAFGDNHENQCNIPALPAGLTYVQADAGAQHTVLLRSDGTAVAVGSNFWGQRGLPAQQAGVTYTQVSAGACHTALLRSDGSAVVVGQIHNKQEVPPLEAGVSTHILLLVTNIRCFYAATAALLPLVTTVQASVTFQLWRQE